MTLGELLTAARELLDDTVEDFLWSEEKLTRYANNAVREVCLRTRCMKDDSAPRCRVALVPGTDTYAVDPSFLVIAKAQLWGQSFELHRSTTEEVSRMLPGWDVGCVQPAKPEFIVFDRVQNTIRVAPSPDQAYDLHLKVMRLPDEDERMEGPDDEPVVSVVAAEEMKHWIAHEAFMEKDSERYDPERSAAHLRIFTDRFGDRPSNHALALWSTQPIVRTRPCWY
ncbi:MAG: DUF6682 family protein [Silanimonas sp.]